MGLSHIEAQNDTNYLIISNKFFTKIDKRSNPVIGCANLRNMSQGIWLIPLLLIGMAVILINKFQIKIQKEAVYIYCLSGGRSHTAAEKMRSKGILQCMRWKVAFYNGEKQGLIAWSGRWKSPIYQWSDVKTIWRSYKNHIRMYSIDLMHLGVVKRWSHTLSR